MKKGNTPLGVIETIMLNGACNEIGKELGLPTHAYMGLSDSKRLDSQSGFESGIGHVIAALAGVNMVAGPGMMAFENCQSAEKLVIDNELCGMAKRIIAGMKPQVEDGHLANDLFSGDIFEGKHFLTSPMTVQLLEDEFYSPSYIVDRKEQDAWAKEGSSRTDERAHRKVNEILATHETASLTENVEKDLDTFIKSQAEEHGLDQLPHESVEICR